MNKRMFLVLAMVSLINLKAIAGIGAIVKSTTSLALGAPLVVAGVFLGNEALTEFNKNQGLGGYTRDAGSFLKGENELEKFINKNGKLIVAGGGSIVCLLIGGKLLLNVVR